MNFVTVVGICLAVLLILLLVYVFPMLCMHPLVSGKVKGTDILAIRNRSNDLFFIPIDDDWIVIDAGSDVNSVKREMKKFSIDEDRVKAVFLTHTDYDHVAAISLFSNAIIYMSRQEKQMIDGSTTRQFIKKNRLPKCKDSNEIVYLEDNQVIDVPKHKVRMIWAPGHTRGSALYVLDEKYLFTGDAFQIKNHSISVHPYTMDKKQAQKTIQRLKDEMKNYEKVFSAHYGFLEN